ncbi:hypothetical protein DdX_18997 [Ditylenchus destructor]|uniref:Uncharacterized protein n=1 Tax=Ditylenchus destructor TaxID=166010 RepID=A0AAD4MJ89_9BILA|nr:hypothetical protein DdX_18997 [Ditylenchus destructor]
MSSLLIPTIKYCYTEALSILSKKIDLTLPDPMPDVGAVRSMSNKASNAEEEATLYLDLLEKSHEQWIKLLSSMTEKERIIDSEIQTTFLSDLRRLKNVYDYSLNTPVNPSDSVTKAAPPMVRLPQIKLATFSGDLSERPSFWEKFNHSIHKVDDNIMPPVLKLNYLFECLSGKSHSGLPVEDSSYDTAITILDSVFGNSLAIKEYFF